MTEDLSDTPESAAPEETSAAALSARLLEEEALREEQNAAIAITLADDQIPGVGADEMSLRQGLKIGGLSMVTVLGLAQFIEWVDRAGFNVLAPDIQKSLHVSDAVIAAIGGAFGVLFLAGSIPISSLADRKPRTKIAAASLAAWAAIVFLSALVKNAFQLFLARLGSGLGQSYELPVNSPLLIDTYPIEAHGSGVRVVQHHPELRARHRAPRRGWDRRDRGWRRGLAMGLRGHVDRHRADRLRDPAAEGTATRSQRDAGGAR